MCAHIQLQEEDEDDETEAEADPVMQQLARGLIPNAGMSKLFLEHSTEVTCDCELILNVLSCLS